MGDYVTPRMSEEVRKRIDPNDTARKVSEKVKKGPNWYGTKISEGGRMYVTDYQVRRGFETHKPHALSNDPKYANPFNMQSIDSDLANKEKQQLKQKQNQKYQTTGKKSLLNEQPTRKGGGKSGGGGGGGKWSLINRTFGRRSPWSLLSNNKNF